MMVNIGRKMPQELEEAGTRRPGAGLGLSLDTKEAELALVWEEMWGRGRLDIAGTKAIARVYTLGGAEWFETVLVEQLLGLVYSTDLDRATAAVFSLLHIDLVPCSLALLMHTLPRCLVGEGREQLLVHPGAKCLARLTVDCLSLSSRGSTAYTGRGSTADLAAICDDEEAVRGPGGGLLCRASPPPARTSWHTPASSSCCRAGHEAGECFVF